MSSQLKAPPTVNAEGDDYLSWKMDVEARVAARELKPEEIGSEDGVKVIVVKMDKVYIKDKNTYM